MGKDDFEKGLKKGTNEPRSPGIKFMDEMADILPSPKTKKYKDYERGRDLGEKRAEKMQAEKAKKRRKKLASLKRDRRHSMTSDYSSSDYYYSGDICPSTKSDFSWIWWVIGVVFLLASISLCSGGHHSRGQGSHGGSASTPVAPASESAAPAPGESVQEEYPAQDSKEDSQSMQGKAHLTNEFTYSLCEDPQNTRLVLNYVELITPNEGNVRVSVVSCEKIGNTLHIRTAGYYPKGSRVMCSIGYKYPKQSSDDRVLYAPWE